MVGYNESELLRKIEEGSFALFPKRKIPREQTDFFNIITDRMKLLAKGVAKTIASNNRQIEDDLRRAGVNL